MVVRSCSLAGWRYGRLNMAPSGDRRKDTNFVTSQILSTCPHHSKPYMILKGLVKGFQNNIEFGIVRARGKDL